MLLDADESQLVLVDFQERLLPAVFQGADCLANALKLAIAAQRLDLPAWATEQNPNKLGGQPAQLQALCRQTLPKMHFSAAEEGLTQWLRPEVATKPPVGNARSLPKHLQKPAGSGPERNSVVIAGVEAHVCVLQTALDLLEDEFEVWVVTDACSSRTERNRDAAYDRLAGAGAELVTTEMVLFEWLRTAEHPEFKAIQALIK